MMAHSHNTCQFQYGAAPSYEQFGLTEAAYNEEKVNRERIKNGPNTGLYGALLFFLAGVPLTMIHNKHPEIAIALFIIFIVGLIYYDITTKKKLKSLPITPNYDQYNEALERWLVSQDGFWRNVSGREFEYRVASLFHHLGYTAILTPGSNDGGVDIILQRGGEKYAVQCKCHKNPSGPKDARELYGAMIANDYNKGILVNPSGFTKGVHTFARDKPIDLINIDWLIQKAREINMPVGTITTLHLGSQGQLLR